MGRLFINNKEVELPKNFKFARTKQVNTIGRLDNRQASFTQTIKLPRTKKNTEIFGYLGTLGNTSKVPYQLATARYVNESGVDEIFNGTAIIRNTNDSFNLSIYDGYISFTKAIENRVLTDVDLSELNHLKNLDSVTGSWTNDLNYKYLVADYNGNSVVDDKLNIDFLIPSVNVKFLWDKVHEFAGFTYQGSVFNSDFFKNLWITYPKTIGEGTQQTISLLTNTWDGELSYFVIGQPIGTVPKVSTSFSARRGTGNTPNSIDNAYLRGHSLEIQNLISTGRRYIDNFYLEVKQNALFKFTISGVINRANAFLTGGGVSLNLYDPPIDLPIPDETRSIGDFTYGQNFSFTFYSNIEAGRQFEVAALYNGLTNISELAVGNVTLEIEAVTGNTVDFEEAFINFKIKDFVNEVLWRFSLTPFKDKYDNNIRYLTTGEWLQSTQRVDWSASQNKYIEQVNETYVLAGYAQRNFMRYKYNDDNFTHNDGFLVIDNRNIKDETDIIRSRLFSPEPETSNLLGIEYNIYPFWEKQPQEDGEIKYKDLENRFYIIQSQRIDASLPLTTDISKQDRTVTAYDRELFTELPFFRLIERFYRPIYSILNNARILTANIYLTDVDIANLDFTKLYYIREQGSYFILNKIPNYIRKGEYKVELVEVDVQVTNPDVGDPGGATPSIRLTSEANPPLIGGQSNWSIDSTVQFVSYTPTDDVIITAKQIDPITGNPTGIEMTADIDENIGVHRFDLPNPLTLQTCGRWEMQATDNARGFNSNVVTVNVPCPASVGDPEIIIEVESRSLEPAPINRDVFYTFKNFTPTSATMTIQQINLVTKLPTGPITTITNLDLNRDIRNVLDDVEFIGGAAFYRIIVTTNQVTITAEPYVF